MTQNINQFGITPEAGDAVFAPVQPLNVRLASTAGSNIVAGTFVKAVGTVGDVILVAPSSATDTAYLGVVKRNIRSMPVNAGDIVGVLGLGSIVYITASGAITANTLVEVVAGGQVKASAGANPTVGVCLNNVANGELAMIQLLPATAIAG